MSMKTSRVNGQAVSRGTEQKDTPPASLSSHLTVALVFLFLLVDLLGFTVILPLMPSILEYYSKRDEVCQLQPVLIV